MGGGGEDRHLGKVVRPCLTSPLRQDIGVGEGEPPLLVKGLAVEKSTQAGIRRAEQAAQLG